MTDTQRAMPMLDTRRAVNDMRLLRERKIEKVIDTLDELSETVPVIFLGTRREVHPSIDLVVSQSLTADILTERLKTAPRDPYIVLDRRLAAGFAESSVIYVSTIDTICAPECDILLPNGDLVNTDYGHCSPDGATHMVRLPVARSEVFARLLGRPD